MPPLTQPGGWQRMGAGYASLDKPTDDTQQRTRLAIQDAQAEGVTLPQAPSGSKRGRARAVELNLPKTGQFRPISLSITARVLNVDTILSVLVMLTS